jgi:ABC-type nitrate/sulfonate/bicarbonate transport system substrate-binding protein
MVSCAALVVRPDSSVYTPQDLAHRVVGLDYGNGTAYAGLQMLEGAMPREAITTCAASANASARFGALMRGEFEATVLQEPYITAAARAGCRLVSTTFFYGTWVADPNLDPEVQAAFLRGITHAVERINANKRQYVHYFTDDWAGHPEIDALGPDDFDLGRIQLKAPGPIPESDARWAWEWMVSWGVLEGSFEPASQLDNRVAERLVRV